MSRYTIRRTEGDHNPFSFSNMPRVSSCPASVLAQQGIPDIPEPQGESGTRIHAALAAEDPAGLELEEEAIYEQCMEWEENTTRGAKEFHREWYGVLHECEDGSGDKFDGTADLVALYPTRGLIKIIDYKTGRRPLDPRNVSIQGGGYASTALKHFGEGYHRAEVRFYLPRLRKDFKCLVERDQIPENVQALENARERALSRPEFNPTYDNCRYCRARSLCGAARS